MVLTLLTLLLILWFGLVAPLLYRAEFSLCGLNITDESSSFIAYEFLFGIYNPTISDLVVPGAHVALVADEREPEAVPLELEGGARKSVDYGALVACELSDVTLPAGRSSPMRLTCALSQYSSQRRALSNVVNTMVDGSGDLLHFSMRYHGQLGALGLGPFTVQGGQQFQLDPNSTRPEPSPPLPPQSPPSLLPPSPSSPPSQPPQPPQPQSLLGGRFNDRHCSGENATRFDWQLFVAGTSIGIPENAAERRRLFSVCGIALCEREAGVPDTDVSAACAWALSDRLSASRLVGRVGLSVFNPVSIALSLRGVGISLALSPSSAVWTDTAVASVVASGEGSVLACSMPGSVKLKGASWTEITLECAIGPALANLTADYQAGATSSLNAAFFISASAFGVSFSGDFTSAFDLSTADVDLEPPRVEYVPVPALPPDCAEVRASVDAVEPWSSEKADATLAALEFVFREGLVRGLG